MWKGPYSSIELYQKIENPKQNLVAISIEWIVFNLQTYVQINSQTLVAYIKHCTCFYCSLFRMQKFDGNETCQRAFSTFGSFDLKSKSKTKTLNRKLLLVKVFIHVIN